MMNLLDLNNKIKGDFMKYFIFIFISVNLLAATNNDMFDTIMENYNKSLSLSIEKNKVIKKIETKKENIQIITIKNEYQNLRVSPLPTSKILNVLSKGNIVRFLSKTNINNQVWLKVQYKNSKNIDVVGYIFQR